MNCGRVFSKLFPLERFSSWAYFDEKASGEKVIILLAFDNKLFTLVKQGAQFFCAILPN